MNKTLLFAAWATIALATPLQAETSSASDTIPVHVKTQEGLQDPSGPRVPSSIRIECEYDTTTDELIVYMAGVSGMTDASVENLDTGDSATWQLVGSGIFYLPISGSAGLWQVTFTLANGDEFEGEFVL
ncbi:MAG: hypothetical protein J5939_01960 [Bacteroidales bacterium]|nr:hypothetical protein [Bacteroidales bacterium]